MFRALRWLIPALSALALSGAAMTLEFRLSPDGPPVSSLPLKASFYVFLDGRPDEARLYLWNAVEDKSLVVDEARAQGEGLLWGPIALRRPCDPAPEGTPSLVAAVGDLVVAAVDVAEGISAAARVAAPEPGPRVLKVLNSEGREVTELCCGTYTLRLEAPDLDVECKPETVAFDVLSGGSSTSIVLTETGDATGVFTASLRVEYLCSACELSATVAGLILPTNAEVSFVNGDLRASSTVRLAFTAADMCQRDLVSLIPPFPLSRVGSEQTPSRVAPPLGKPKAKEKSAPALGIKPTAAAALPGKEFLVELELLLPKGLQEASLRVGVPPGWGVRIGGVCGEVLPCPVRAGPDGMAHVPVILDVPPNASGRYRITFSLPDLGMKWGWELGVRGCLDPVDVVRHWDVGRGDVDLSQPGKVTLERLLLAVARVGEQLPHACRILSENDVNLLAAEWAAAGRESKSK